MKAIINLIKDAETSMKSASTELNLYIAEHPVGHDSALYVGLSVGISMALVSVVNLRTAVEYLYAKNTELRRHL